MVQIPILSEKAAGRHPGAVGPDDIESFIAMPLQAAPRGAGAYTGFIVRGDAMKPTLCDRFIAVIDHANRDAAGLPGRVVALLVDGVAPELLAPPVNATVPTGHCTVCDLVLLLSLAVDPETT